MAGAGIPTAPAFCVNNLARVDFDQAQIMFLKPSQGYCILSIYLSTTAKIAKIFIRRAK
jgi:hypothetical protein